MTEFWQFLFGPADFSEIHDFSKILDLKDYGGLRKTCAKGPIFISVCHIDTTHILGSTIP